jgi:hypothetical protein
MDTTLSPRGAIQALGAGGVEGTSALELAFAHPLYRTAIYADLSPARRRDDARTDPTWVRSFAGTHELSPLSPREALKHLS